jgi:L-asparagine transporter-like permease
MRALGELILSDIKKNTYIDFITEYLGKSIGTTTGYLYWFSWLTLAMAGNYRLRYLLSILVAKFAKLDSRD